MLRLFVLLFAAVAGADDFAPLAGTWEGEWRMTRGVEDVKGRFRFVFTANASGMDGRYNNVDFSVTRLDGKPSKASQKFSQKEFKVEKLQAISADPPRYRFQAAGDCWNVDVKPDSRMEGYFNAGNCAAMGMGAGATVVEFTAKKAQ